MRVLLLNPPYLASPEAGLGISFPLGLAYLATALRDHNVDVSVLDAASETTPVAVGNGLIRYGLDSKQLRERIEEEKPNIVGISCFFSSRFPAVLESAKIIKDIDMDIVTITGGIHPSLMPKEVVAHSEIDFAAVGEGERLIVDFIDALNGNRLFDTVESLAFKSNGHVKVNHRTNYIENLDTVGYPAWDLFDMERYLNNHEGRWGLGAGRYAPIVTSRSCPYKCTFCSIHSVMGTKYRGHSPAYVVKMIKKLVDDYNVDEISFEDDNLTYEKVRFIEICKGIIDNGIKIRWNTPNGVHVGSLDRESIDWAKKAGCDSLNLAIESGDDHIRNRVIKKGLKQEKIYEVAKACRDTGIKTNAYFVIGMPGETESSIENTRKYIRDLKFNNVSVFIATPMPGTKLYDEVLEKGYIKKEDFDSDFINYQATIFTQPSIETPDFDRAKIELWRYRLFNEYFKSTLKDRFFGWMLSNPRAWMSMAVKVTLFAILGENISYKLVNLLRGK